MRLAGHIVELSWGFKIYPPREVTDDPSVLRAISFSENYPTRSGGCNLPTARKRCSLLLSCWF